MSLKTEGPRSCRSDLPWPASWHQRRSPRLTRKVRDPAVWSKLVLGKIICKHTWTPRDLAYYIKARRGNAKDNSSSVTLALSAPALPSTVKPHLHHQYIDQERVLLFANELIVQPVPPSTNPGSLTMGFAGVDRRQLAPSVGTTQVGITISAVPSSASYNSRARTRPSPLEGFKITADISATPSRPLELQLGGRGSLTTRPQVRSTPGHWIRRRRSRRSTTR